MEELEELEESKEGEQPEESAIPVGRPPVAGLVVDRAGVMGASSQTGIGAWNGPPPCLRSTTGRRSGPCLVLWCG
ncbi:hypothetical protein GCM10018790_00490 [Kitasatospora xanthocidica]|nr:hypothetical protein GCM10018790_00490 [Kitasatospora xanthocidica]